MLRIILFAVLLLVAVLLVLAAVGRPKHFRIQRSLVMRAPRASIFALVADFHAWANWSPWEKLDASMIKRYSGAASGRGTVYEWSGNKKVGRGRMEIVAARSPENLEIKLDFYAPFEAHNVAEFQLRELEGGTEVTWAMHGPSPFISRLMGLFINMDQLIGKEFETGLGNLKSLSESQR